MRKLVQIISAAVLSVAFIGVSASAQVAPSVNCDDITIINTGDDSENNVTCETVTTTTIECNNNVIVGNVNFQGGESGEGEVEGNNGTGSVNTGTVVNYNGTQTTIGAACGETTGTTTGTPTPTPSVSPSPSASPAPAKPAALPFTAGASTESVVVASLAAAAFVVIASRVLVAAYRRFSVK